MKGYIRCKRCGHIVYRPEGITECLVCYSRNLEKSSKIKMENYLEKVKRR